VAVGRLKGGPEADLIADYKQRFDRTGRALSLGPLEIVEVEDNSHKIWQAGAIKANAIASSLLAVPMV